MKSSADETSNAEPPFELMLNRGQAGLMAFAGVFIIFGGFLLGFVQLEPQIPLGWRVAVGLLSLYLAWVGLSYILGARRWLREPVITISLDLLTSHDEIEPREVAIDAITIIEMQDVRGVRRAIVRWPDGSLEIPGTLAGYDEALGWLRDRVAAASDMEE